MTWRDSQHDTIIGSEPAVRAHSRPTKARLPSLQTPPPPLLLLLPGLCWLLHGGAAVPIGWQPHRSNYMLAAPKITALFSISHVASKCPAGRTQANTLLSVLAKRCCAHSAHVMARFGECSYHVIWVRRRRVLGGWGKRAGKGSQRPGREGKRPSTPHCLHRWRHATTTQLIRRHSAI